MTLTRFVVRRAVLAVLLVFLVTSAAALLALAAPGDFVSAECFDQPAACAKQREALGLDRSVMSQYRDWLARALTLDLGESLKYKRPVSSLLGERSLNTAVLAFAALLTATLLGIPLGVYTGVRKTGPGVRIVRLLSLILLSTPPLLASLALVVFAARTGWLPVGGMQSAGASGLSWGAWILDLVSHLPLPALALGLPLAATIERVQSQALSATSREPFVHAARARGVPLDGAVLRHGWRVSLGGVLGLYGLMIGALFSGSFIVEVITAWPGLGRLMYDALVSRDINLTAGTAAAGTLFLAMGTLVADVLLAVADPRTLAGVES